MRQRVGFVQDLVIDGHQMRAAELVPDRRRDLEGKWRRRLLIKAPIRVAHRYRQRVAWAVHVAHDKAQASEAACRWYCKNLKLSSDEYLLAESHALDQLVCFAGWMSSYSGDHWRSRAARTLEDR